MDEHIKRCQDESLERRVIILPDRRSQILKLRLAPTLQGDFLEVGYFRLVGFRNDELIPTRQHIPWPIVGVRLVYHRPPDSYHSIGGSNAGYSFTSRNT